MGIRHIITTILVYLANRKFKTKSVNEPSREHCLALLKLLQPEAFAKYKPTEWINKSIELVYPRVNLFTGHLHKLNKLIAAADMIESGSIVDYRIPVDLDTFFTTSTGYHINHLSEVTEFKEAATKLCDLTEHYKEAKYGVDAHNRRMLTSTYIDIRNLTLILLQVK